MASPPESLRHAQSYSDRFVLLRTTGVIIASIVATLPMIYIHGNLAAASWCERLDGRAPREVLRPASAGELTYPLRRQAGTWRARRHKAGVLAAINRGGSEPDECRRRRTALLPKRRDFDSSIGTGEFLAFVRLANSAQIVSLFGARQARGPDRPQYRGARTETWLTSRKTRRHAT
jgi:hypothetical protein